MERATTTPTKFGMSEIMDKRREEITRRPLYVYDLPSDILSTLARKDETDGDSQDDIGATATATSVPESQIEHAVVGSKVCSLCGVNLHTVEDHRSHVRSDLHTYNLKQKLRGASSVTEDQFEKLVKDLDESLSGSDSSDSEDDEDGEARKETTLSALLKKQAAVTSTSEGVDGFATKKRKPGPGKSPLFWFTTPTLPSNTYLGIYRAIFSATEQESDSAILDTVRQKQLAPKSHVKISVNAGGLPLPEAYKEPHVFLCMIGGGHFAAMIVSLTPKQVRSSPTGPLSKEATVIAHKTFHRYTTRRKQGGAQSANDAAKGAAHSAGSSLRRYNEQALTDEVRLLLQEWKAMIDTSELLFIRATGSTSRRTLFGPYDGQVLRNNDTKLRGFPFSTRRATQNELMRSFVELTRVKVVEVDEAAIASAKLAAAESARQSAAVKASKDAAPTAPERSEKEEIALLHTTQLHALVKRVRVPGLLSYIKSNDLSPDFLFYPSDSQQSHHAPTPLHLAASQNSAPLISGLLVKAGANPTIKNGDGKTAFDLSGDRSTRDAFRVARSELGESKWDWEAAHVPVALSRKEADDRDALEKKTEAKKEEDRRTIEAARLKEHGPKVIDSGPMGKGATRGRMAALGQVAKTAQEKREEEARGMTPEMRIRLDRERRARAAEARMKGVS